MSQLVRLADDWSAELTQALGEAVIAFSQLEHVLTLILKRSSVMSLTEAMERAREIGNRPALCREVAN